MRSFQGNGVQGNRGGLGKQPLSLAKQPLDVGLSFLQKNNTNLDFSRFVLFMYGGGGKARTYDLMHVKHAL